MKYFSLRNGNSVIAKWSDDRTVEFFSHRENDEEVGDIVERFELLREHNVPIYTEERLNHFFPELREISEKEYTAYISSIDQHNAEADQFQKEIETETNASMTRYVATFAANHPTLLNFRQVSELVEAFSAFREYDQDNRLEEDPNFNADEDAEEYLVTVFALLKHVEKSSDPSVVLNILKVVND